VRPRRRAASATTAVVVLLALFASVPVWADTKSELAAAKKRLSQLEAEIHAAQAQRDSLQAEVDAIAGQIARTTEAIEQTEARIEATQTGIVRRQRRIDWLQNRLAMRARDAYIKGPGGIFEVIFGSSSFGDLSDRLALYESVQQSDADLATEIEAERVALEGRRAELEEIQAELQAQREMQEANLGAQTSKLGEMVRLQAGLDERRREAAGIVTTLLKKFKAEQEAIRRARELANGGGIVHGTGVFEVCPVDPPNSFTNDFGAPRVGHTHQGNDIFAPYGTPIRAPFDGTASDASNSVGGLSVYVHGPAGYVYNAHLSSFGQMGSVDAGDIIGYVGNTGNARYTPPHDHFEWHPGGGSAVTPYYYLLDACR
jgi:peptidoglycan hydrolase CwlO-like protein